MSDDTENTADYDVVVVGGGPAGCSAALFTARYGLDTAVFDRGKSSLRRCAYLENYLGFPAGIDIETFYGLIRDHVDEAGCERLAEMVEAVDRSDGQFVVETQEGRTVTANRVVAAARYDAEFLRPLDDGEMFETYEHGGEPSDRFDRDYPREDGSTPVEGLYVAAPVSGVEAQAIISAGYGARVARTLLADVRRERGYPDTLADHWDWVRRDAELSGEWAERDRWREWFDEQIPADCEVDEGRLVELRERQIDRRFEAYLSEDEIDRRSQRGQRRLLDHVDDDLVLEAAREIEAERETAAATRGDEQ